MSWPAGFRVEAHGTVGSTNDLIRAAALRGEPEGLWITAEAQTGGRGRHGRAWTSPAGNFYGSLLLRPKGDLARIASLSLVIGLALADTVQDLSRGALAPRLKWPNDVLLDGAKLAGILLEGEPGHAAGDGWLVVGLGVNLISSPDGAPYPTTSLRAAGLAGITPAVFLAAFCPVLQRHLTRWSVDGFAACRPAWLARAHGIGQPAMLRRGQSVVTGRLLDVDADGAVSIEEQIGQAPTRFTAGELFFG